MANPVIHDLFVAFLPEDGKLTPAARYAVSLARAANAALTARALGVKIWQPFGVAPAISGAYVQTANAAAQDNVDRAVAALTDACGGMTGSLDIAGLVRSHADITTTVSFLGRLHDLAITDSGPALAGEGRAIIEELLFNAGRPLIVAPNSATEFRADVIVVAWDGSGRAARAVNDAMPFLAAAKQVQLVCVTNEKSLATTTPGVEIAPHLARHGVKLDILELTPPDRDAGRAILDAAAKAHADLIVMGAYGHSRFRQITFGGVTRAMLEQGERAVFFSH